MKDEAVAKSARDVASAFWNRLARNAGDDHGRLVLVGDPRSAEFAEPRDGNRDLLEFILNHEEIVFFLEERSFHICTEHRQARAILERLKIPARFRCALRGEDCPMRVISRAAGESAIAFSVGACR